LSFHATSAEISGEYSKTVIVICELDLGWWHYLLSGMMNEGENEKEIDAN